MIIDTCIFHRHVFFGKTGVTCNSKFIFRKYCIFEQFFCYKYRFSVSSSCRTCNRRHSTSCCTLRKSSAHISRIGSNLGHYKWHNLDDMRSKYSDFHHWILLKTCDQTPQKLSLKQSTFCDFYPGRTYQQSEISRCEAKTPGRCLLNHTCD